MQVNSELSRTEAIVLNTLRDGPRRITELAGLEGLAQPTATLPLKRLEELGLIKRKRQADDGPVVLVSPGPAGIRALEDFRGRLPTATAKAGLPAGMLSVMVAVQLFGAVACPEGSTHTPFSSVPSAAGQVRAKGGGGLYPAGAGPAATAARRLARRRTPGSSRSNLHDTDICLCYIMRSCLLHLPPPRLARATLTRSG
jgi:DNA-binding MarR family transcriptional regulator